MSNRLNIGVIPGDGIGREVIPEGVRVLEAAVARHDLELSWTDYDWSCETYLATGAMMPEDGITQLAQHDAIYLGAVGFPTVPDHLSLWGLLIPIRRAFDQYINLRPVRLFDGVPCPLAGKRAGAMMLDHLGHRPVHDAIMAAVEQVLGEGRRLTRDMGGTAATTELADAVIEYLG